MKVSCEISFFLHSASPLNSRIRTSHRDLKDIPSDLTFDRSLCRYTVHGRAIEVARQCTAFLASLIYFRLYKEAYPLLSRRRDSRPNHACTVLVFFRMFHNLSPILVHFENFVKKTSATCLAVQISRHLWWYLVTLRRGSKPIFPGTWRATLSLREPPHLLSLNLSSPVPLELFCDDTFFRGQKLGAGFNSVFPFSGFRTLPCL